MDENAYGKYAYKTEIHKGTKQRALRISYVKNLEEAKEKPPEIMEEKQKLQCHGFKDLVSGPKCPILEIKKYALNYQEVIFSWTCWNSFSKERLIPATASHENNSSLGQISGSSCVKQEKQKSTHSSYLEVLL